VFRWRILSLMPLDLRFARVNHLLMEHIASSPNELFAPFPLITTRTSMRRASKLKQGREQRGSVAKLLLSLPCSSLSRVSFLKQPSRAHAKLPGYSSLEFTRTLRWWPETLRYVI
jgi:hypothetical protein